MPQKLPSSSLPPQKVIVHSSARCNCLNFHLQTWKNKTPSPQNSLVHHHRLLYTGSSAILSENQNGIWRCAVCKNTSDTLNQTFSYHCSTCDDFHICPDCFKPKRHPSHMHELNLVNTSLVYEQKKGHWVCDICGNESRWFEKYVVILVFTDAISSTGISNG